MTGCLFLLRPEASIRRSVATSAACAVESVGLGWRGKARPRVVRWGGVAQGVRVAGGEEALSPGLSSG